METSWGKWGRAFELSTCTAVSYKHTLCFSSAAFICSSEQLVRHSEYINILLCVLCLWLQHQQHVMVSCVRVKTSWFCGPFEIFVHREELLILFHWNSEAGCCYDWRQSRAGPPRCWRNRNISHMRKDWRSCGWFAWRRGGWEDLLNAYK